MKPLAAQLAHAYRDQLVIYDEVKQLVRAQTDLMVQSRDVRAVLGLCQQVERRMADIATIESAIESAKEQWEKSREGRSEELDEVLTAVEAAIHEIVTGQQQVQEQLVAYVRAQREHTEGARNAINVSRARSRYAAG